MSIICLSKDTLFVQKIVALFGSENVISLPNLQVLSKYALEGYELLVVDLIYAEIPKDFVAQLPLIALTEIPTFQEALLLLQRGVKGYGNRQMRIENLNQAVETVKSGQIWLPPTIITQLISSAGTGQTVQNENDILEILSKREQEVALYVAQGMSNQEMADKMFVSVRTIKAHLTAIYEKTGLRNRLELGLRLKKNTVQ